tara:strand:- start:283 stop:8439 length:8157 start_codon:yes stop_codon:yes gene_type:complete
MPKSLKEIKGFTQGTIHNISERDISDDTAAFSLNIDPMSENGSLDSIKNDRMIFATNNALTRFSYPVSWGSSNQYKASGNYNTSSVMVPDISIFSDKDDISNIHLIGTKGRKEKLKVMAVSPWWERAIANSTLNITYTPGAAITSTQDTIPFLTNTNAIVENALADADFEATGFIAGEATLECKDAVITNYDTTNDNYFTITTPDGRAVSYKFLDGSATSATGTTGGGYTIIGMSDVTANVTAIATNVKNAIEHANGHGGRITITQASGVLSLTYTHLPLDSYLSPGDYLVLTSSMNATADEYIKINSVDPTGTFGVTRNVLGSPVKSYVTTTEYEVWSNKLTIDGRQSSTPRGILSLYDWSNYSGNNIGGNGNWANKVSTALHKEDLGVIDTSANTQTITFSNSAKTITFNNLGSSNTLHFNEGDTVTFYYGADGDDEPNNGKSFKILKSERTDSNADWTWTVDTAPADDTETADTVYIEANLIKNHTFHHSSDEINPTVNVGSGLSYAVNNWEIKHYSYSNAFGGEDATMNNSYTSGLSKNKVSRINTGGYWEDTTADHGADNAESYYPFNANDAYLRIEAEYKDTTLVLTADITASDSFLPAGNKQKIAVNDILKVTNEYMKVTSMTANKLFVERGILGSDADGHSEDDSILKSINPLIGQNVSKDRLKAGQPYILTFYAKDLYATSNYGHGAVSVEINGGYFDMGGEWNKASLNNKNGYNASPQNIMQENRWIGFENLITVNGDAAFNADDTESSSNLDTTWRRYELPLYLPKGFDLSTDMNIEFTSRGKDGTQIGMDIVDLSEMTYVVPISTESKVDSVGSIDNAGSKDLVLFDNKAKKIKVVKNFKQDRSTPFPLEEDIEKSPFAAKNVSSSTGKASFVSKNRETHISFGPKSEDSPPQWLGYLNNKTFGIDSTKTLYQDEDTVHSYNTTGIMAMSKIALAGEHENIVAYWNLSGTFNDGEAVSLAVTTLRIYHAAHSMVAGNNIVLREYLDIDNSWDGNGVWVVIATSTNYFDCHRIDSKDKDPAEEGCFTIASTSTSGGTVTINCGENHSLAVGDEVIIASTSSFNGTKTVAAITDADTFTFTETITDADETGKAAKKFRLNYRPYYYYGIKDGDNHLYRMLPDDLYTDATTVSTTYQRGNIEKSLPLSFTATSITTCYNKDTTNGIGGGRVYVLSDNGEIKVVDIQQAFNKWNKLNLTVLSHMSSFYKAYKWSNDNVNGNVNGDTAVFDSIAAESTPTIIPSGIASDILETKGSNKDFDYDATGRQDLDHFDTRLWVQFRPVSGESFTSSDRFLFCGLSTTDNTNATGDIFLGDRTPPTNSIFSKRIRWNRDGHMFHAGPGLWTDAHSLHSGSDTGEFPTDKLKYHALFNGSRHGGSHSEGYQKEKFNLFGIKTEKGEVYEWIGGGIHQFDWGPEFNFGNNVGWDADGGNLASIQVAKYGLFPMGDNNCDGVIDGTGLVTCSNQSLTQVDGSQINNQNLGPYGYEHETVCSHAVGLIAGADNPWIKDFGAVTGHQPSASDGSRYYKGIEGRAPENMSCEKFVFICSDVHFGDKHFECLDGDGYITPIAPYDETVNWNSLGGGTATQMTVSSTAGFKPGQNIYITDRGVCTIIKIDSDQKFTVNFNFSSASASHKIRLFTNAPYLGTDSALSDVDGPPGGVEHQHYHWAFDSEDPLNSEIFTNPEDGGGHYSKTWWTVPDTVKEGGAIEAETPGYTHRVDRLNYRAGYLIRPFDLDDNTFEDMIIGRGLYVDAPVRPEAIYHVENSNATHNNQGGNINNQFSSKIFITAPVEDSYGEAGNSKMYICDPTFEYPDILHQIEKTQSPGTNTTNEWNGVETSYAPLLYGKIDSYITSSATTTNAHKSANIYPLIEIASGDCVEDGKENFSNMNGLNEMVGQMITIVDAATGVMQTRQIVTSHLNSTLFVGVHFPFGHAPVANDLFYIWSHRSACTSPIRLFREKELDFSLAGDGNNTIALSADPVLSAPVYKTKGTISGIDGSTSLITVDTSDIHALSTNDVIIISDTANYEAYGPHKVTVTGPKQFTIAGTFLDVDSESVGLWTLQEIDASDSSSSNPARFNISQPLVLSTFGGLDTRKTRSIVTTDDDIQGSAVTAELAVHSAAHFLQAGDTVTIKANTGAHDGTYAVNAITVDDFDVLNPSTANDTTDAQPITTNQWENVVIDTAGGGNSSEIRAGFNAWDTGQSQGNILRNDNDTASEGDKYLNTTDASVTITSPSLGDETNDFFLKNNDYEYKISLIYDGYQEGPLSTSTWLFKDTNKTREKLRIAISILNYSKRLTHICLYRRDNKDSFFRLIKQIPTSGGWNFDGTTYNYAVDDFGNVQASYSARTGRSEVLDTIKLKYGISAEIDGFLFAANCSHENIENASNQIFRSKPGQYSVFDYAFDFMQLKSKPTALANFAGRLYAFDESNIYKINQQNLAIEDTYEGIGCLSKDSVIVTEYGMFFADKNGAYMHDGQSPKKISGPIEQGGDTNNEWSGTDNIRDISWKSIVGNSLSNIPYVSFDANISSVLFFATYNDYNTDTGLSMEKQYAWSFNLNKSRWDLWEVSQDASIGVPFIGDKGAVFIPVDNVVYEYRGGSSKRDYTWLSKKLTMEEDSILKVYNKIKINGTTDNLLQGGAYKESSDRLLIKTSTGDISTSNITYKDVTGNHTEYKLKSSNKKGRWVQFKLEDMTSSIDSVGIIYRRKSTK